jgi:hypothetical protein
MTEDNLAETEVDDPTNLVSAYVLDLDNCDVILSLYLDQAVPYAKKVCRGSDEGFDAVIKARFAELLKDHLRRRAPFDFFGPDESLASGWERVDWDHVAYLGSVVVYCSGSLPTVYVN